MHASRTIQVLLLGWVVFCGWTLAGMRSYHGVAGEVVERRPLYEVRRTPAHVVARIDVPLPWDEARKQGEGALREYMDAIDSKSALVREIRTDQTTSLWIALPPSYDGGSAPRPQNPLIRLVDMPERTMAVVPLGGWIDQARITHIEEELRAQLARDRYVPFGSTRVVSLSPSWAPGFVRNSELVLSIH